MPKYKYQVVNQAGEKSEGVITGSNKQAVVRKLKDQDCYILQVKKKSRSWRLSQLVNKSKPVTCSQLALFTSQFATLLAAGLSLLTVLTILEQQVANKKLKRAVQKIKQEVKAGQELSTALRKQANLFPKLMINMISAGESNGVLVEVMEQLTDYFQNKADLKQELRSIIVYPLFLLATTIVVVIVLVVFVLPTFAQIFADYDLQLPLITRVLLQGASFIQHKWKLLSGGLLVSAGAVGWCLTTNAVRDQLDGIILQVPIIGSLILRIIILRFAQTLGTMLQAGVKLLPALKDAKKVVGNHQLAQEITDLYYQIEQGQQLGDLLEQEDLFPELLVQMVKAGEETGRLGAMLLQTAEYYQQEIESEVKFLFSLLEPLVVLGLAGGIMIILISVLLPIFNLVNLL